MYKTWTPDTPAELDRMTNEAGVIAAIKEAEVITGHNRDIYVHMAMSFIAAVGAVYPWIKGDQAFGAVLMVMVLFHVSYWVSKITRGPVLVNVGRDAEIERLIGGRAQLLRRRCDELASLERGETAANHEITRGRREVAIRMGELTSIQDLRRFQSGQESSESV